MNRAHGVQLTLVIAGILLVAACGLKDDLFIPTEDGQTAPADAQNQEDAGTEEKIQTDQSSELAL